MIIVISDTHLFVDEHSITNQLFDEGLLVFHLRKYDNSTTEIAAFIEKIKPEHRHKIALHQHHEMANEFGITRLHYSANDRKMMTVAELQNLKDKGMLLSTSIHTIEEYNSLPLCFDYAFISPVFDSISKIGYTAQIFDLTKRNAHSNIKLIALGGVSQKNCQLALEMGFDGVALLGSIWKSEDKTGSFKTIKNSIPLISQMSAEK